MNADMAQI